MRAASVLIVVVAVAAASCDGLELLSPQPSAPGFWVSLLSQQDTQVRRSVSAVLSGGWTNDGHTRQFADSSLNVNGAMVLPRSIQGQQLGFFSTLAPVAAWGSVDTVFVGAPALAASPADSVRIPIIAPARLDLYDIVVSQDSDLVLRLTPVVQMPWPATVTVSWTLSLRSACGSGSTMLWVSASSNYPNEIRVDRALIPAGLGATFAACVSVNINYSQAGAPYSVRVNQNMDVRWRVQLAP